MKINKNVEEQYQKVESVESTSTTTMEPSQNPSLTNSSTDCKSSKEWEEELLMECIDYKPRFLIMEEAIRKESGIE